MARYELLGRRTIKNSRSETFDSVTGKPVNSVEPETGGPVE